MEKDKEKIRENRNVSFFNKLKKPLYSGILAAGLILTPNQRIWSISYPGQGTYYDVTGFVGYGDCDLYQLAGKVKREFPDIAPLFELYRLGKINDLEQVKIFVDYFKDKYKETGSPLALWLYGYFLYEVGRSAPTFEETEAILFEVNEVAKNGLALNPKSSAFANMYSASLFVLSMIYYEAYMGNETYIKKGFIKKNMGEKERNKYKEKCINYINDFMKFVSEIKNKYYKDDELEKDIYFASLSELENSNKGREILIKMIMKELNVDLKSSKENIQNQKKE